MKPKAILKPYRNSYQFKERNLDLTNAAKVGRRVAKCQPQDNNAIFDCEVLSRSHAVIWLENGKFFMKDTGSSNGTFINNIRLSPANESSAGAEIHSNDIIQFGVDVADKASKITYSCITLKIKLYYHNGSGASMFVFPTENLLPPFYSYGQMIEKEQQIYRKLNSIEDILEEAHLLADLILQAREGEQQLTKQLEELRTYCDEKTRTLKILEKSRLDELSRVQNRNSKISQQKDLQLETMRRLLLLLMFIIVIIGGLDTTLIFMRLTIQ